MRTDADDTSQHADGQRACHDDAMELPAQRLAAMLAASPPRAGATRVLAIDGRSGAGKTTLALALAASLDAPVVSLEDLYGGWDGLEHGVTLLASAVLRPLAEGAAAHVPRYDWDVGAWATPWTLEPTECLIVEGAGAGARVLAPYTSVLVWVELASARRRERALARDGERLYGPHWQRWAAQEDDYVAREHPIDRADLVIDAEDPEELLAD